MLVSNIVAAVQGNVLAHTKIGVNFGLYLCYWHIWYSHIYGQCRNMEHFDLIICDYNFPLTIKVMNQMLL